MVPYVDAVVAVSVMRGVGGVCEMCMCLARGGVGGERGEWMRGLGLGFTNPVGTWGVLDVCLCFGVRWYGLCRWGVDRGLDQGLEGCCGVMFVLVVSLDSLYMAGPGICVLCLADTCTSEVHPVFNHVAPYGYLLPNMYLFIAYITNT